MIMFDAGCSVLDSFFSLSSWLTENSLSKFKKKTNSSAKRVTHVSVPKTGHGVTL